MGEEHSAQNDEAAGDLTKDESVLTTTSTEEEYVYTPLKDSEIRLLEILPGLDEDAIQCRLRVASLDDSEFCMPTVPYGALSYTWGNDMTDKRIFVDGKAISVKPNLEAALLEFRRNPPGPTPLNRREKVVATLHRLQTLATQLYEKPQRDTKHDGMVKESEQYLMMCFGQEFPETVAARIKDISHVTEHVIERARRIWSNIAIAEGLSTWENARNYLWVDSLCINQKDYDERAAQVRIMPKIYLNAHYLVIWLGSDTVVELEELATKAYDEITKGFADVEAHNSSISRSEWMEQTPLDMRVHECIADSLLTMLTSPWFTRTWIRQEYILGGFKKDLSEAQPIMVCHGKARIRDCFPITMNLFASWTSPSGDKFAFPGLENYSTRQKLWNLAQIESSRQFFHNYQVQKPSPSPLLTRTMLLRLVSEGQFQATDPRDLIYSVLGLVEACFYNGKDFIPSALVIDYRAPVEAVYSSFVREIVENTERLDILAFCVGDDGSIKKSWVPNWSQFSINHRLGRLAEYIKTGKQMYDTYLDSLPFNATPVSFCDAHFADDLSTLTVSGFLWAEITTETTLLHDEKDEHLRSFCKEIILSNPSINFLHHGTNVTRTRLMACLTLDETLPEKLWPAFEDWITLREDISASTGASAMFLETIKNPGENGLYLRKTIVRTRFGIPRPGDLVCLILGCATPILLRPVENHYKVLGEAYVYGIMDGEAIKVIREERQLMRKFELR